MDTHPAPKPDSPIATTTVTEARSDADRSPQLGALPQPRYSIAAVSKLTGISCHTLRVWERRYGFPVPERSASGHRRYDGAQVQTLCRISELNRSSRQSIGELISRVGGEEAKTEELAVPGAASAEEAARSRLVGKLILGDYLEAEREYAGLTTRLDPWGIVNHVIHPVLIEAGEGWFRKCHSVFQERLITVFMRQKLVLMIQAAREANLQPTRSVIAGTVQGDRHEGGVLMFNLVMEMRGWRVYNLGVDVPVREYGLAIERLRPSALALSFVLSRNIKKRFQELQQIQAVPVFVGGRSIVNYQSMARSHGLIPLVGPILKSTDQLEAGFGRWSLRRGADSEAPETVTQQERRPASPGSSSP